MSGGHLLGALLQRRRQLRRHLVALQELGRCQVRRGGLAARCLGGGAGDDGARGAASQRGECVGRAERACQGAPASVPVAWPEPWPACSCCPFPSCSSKACLGPVQGAPLTLSGPASPHHGPGPATWQLCSCLRGGLSHRALHPLCCHPRHDCFTDRKLINCETNQPEQLCLVCTAARSTSVAHLVHFAA